jgi:hypothetical protein
MRRWLAAAPVAALILLLALLLWPVLFGGRVLLPADLPYVTDPLWRSSTPPDFVQTSNPILADQMTQFYPWLVFARSQINAGSVPLWNPYVNGGQPHLGNGLTGVYGPFDLLRQLLPMPALYGWIALVQLALAGGFTYAYARWIRLRRPAAGLSMIAFVLSGPLTGWLGFPPFDVIVWLPAMLYTVERALASRQRLWVALAATALGAQLLGGQPEVAFQVTCVWLIYALVRGAQLNAPLPKGPGRFAYAVPVLTIAGLGTLLAAVHLLPFVDTVFESAVFGERVAGQTITSGDWWLRIVADYRQWPTLLVTLLPRFFGIETDGGYWFPYSNTVEQAAYAGILPLALALAAVWHAWRSRTAPHRGMTLLWAAIGAASLALALRLPLVNLANMLPVIGLAVPGRLRLVYVFAVAMLAGIGLDLWLADVSPIPRYVQRLLVGGALIAAIASAAAWGVFTLLQEQLLTAGRAYMEANWGTPFFSRPLADYYALVEQRQAIKLALYNPLVTPLMLLPVWVALLWGLSRWRFLRLHRTPGRAAAVILALTLADLLWVRDGVNAMTDPALLEQRPPILASIDRGPAPFRVVATGAILNPNSALLFELQDVRGYDALALARYTALLARLPGYYPVHHHRFFLTADAPLFDLLNVKYLLTDRTPANPRWELVAQDGDIRLYRNREVWPRAYFVQDAVVVASAQEARDRVLDATFDYRRQVVLEHVPPSWTPPTSSPDPAPQVQVVGYSADRVVLQVVTSRPGLVVLTDAYQRGWRAWVNGRSAPVLIANAAFRAVPVGAGSHIVTLAFRPISFMIGAGISAATLAGLLLLAAGRRPRRTPEGSVV